MDNDNKFVVRRSQDRPGQFGVFRGLDPNKGANMRARREVRANRPAAAPATPSPNPDRDRLIQEQMAARRQPTNPGGQVVPPQAGGKVNPQPWQRPAPVRQPIDRITAPVTRSGISPDNPFADWANLSLTDAMAKQTELMNSLADRFRDPNSPEGYVSWRRWLDNSEGNLQDQLTPEERQQISWANEALNNHPNNYQYAPPTDPTANPDLKLRLEQMQNTRQLRDVV